MTYIINGIIKYKAEDGTLWNVNDPDRILNLTFTNSKLLQFFLESNGMVLSRETLLENIWDKQGLRSSNNTLNQYISISRRALSALGAEEVIVTIPRTGFCLHKNVNVTKESDKSEPAPVSPAVNKVVTTASGIKLGLVLLLFFMLLIFTFFLTSYRQPRPLVSQLLDYVPQQRQNVKTVFRLCTPLTGDKICAVVCKQYYP